MFDAEYVQKNKGLLFAVSVAFTLIIVNLVVLSGVARQRVASQARTLATSQPSPSPFPTVQPYPVYVPYEVPEQPQPTARSFVPLFWQPRDPYTGQPLGYSNPFEFIENLIFVLMVGGLLVAFFMLLKGGYLYMVSEGDEKKTKRAKMTIIAAMAGVGIIALASSILSAAGILFGINLFDLSSLAIPGPGGNLYR